MKIIMTVSDQAWGGKQQYMHDVAEGLRARGHDTTVVCEQGGRMHRRYQAIGRPHTTVTAFASAPEQATNALRLLLDGPTRPDVLIISGRHDAEIARRTLAEEPKRPALVLFRHSAFPLAEGDHTQRLLGMLDLVVTTSVEQAHRQFSSYVEAGILRSDQVHVMLSSVPPELRARLADTNRQVARESLKIDDEAFVFLVSARLSWEKGVDRVLAAFAALPEEVRSFALVAVVGEGPEELALRAQCSASEIEEQVMFFGHHDDMALLYAAADVLVLATTVPETGPLALKEGMAAGLPVIASRLGGIPEFVHDEVHGILVDDDTQLAAALDRMVRDEALAGAMGARARLDVSRKEVLGPRLDHLELRLCALHLSVARGGGGLAEYTWAEVRLKDEGDQALVFVPATSLITVLAPDQFEIISESVNCNDTTLLDDPRLSMDAVERLLRMGALVPLRAASMQHEVAG